MPKDSPFNTCLICASSDLREITANRNFGINIVQCNACNFVQSEFVSQRGLESYYRNFYRGRLDEQGLAAHRQKGLEQARSQMAYLLEQRPGLKISTALDYGTAEGSLGHELRGIADKVWVTEMDPQFVELLRKDALLTLVEHKELSSGAFDRFFDLACISHVLEHLTDPYEAMDVFASVLKPGGLLLVDIPNEVRMLQRGFQAKGHLTYFTKQSFAQFVDTHGCFDLVETRTCNREVDMFIDSGFTAPEDYSIPLARDGTVIRALLQNRPAAARQRRRIHAFDEAALLNEYSARILHLYMLLGTTQGRLVQREQELQQELQKQDARRRVEAASAPLQAQGGTRPAQNQASVAQLNTSSSSLRRFADTKPELNSDDMLRMDAIRQTVPGYSEGMHYAFFKHLLACASIRRLLILGVYYSRDIAYLMENARVLGRPLQVTGVDKFSDDFCDDWPKERRSLNWQQAGFGTPPNFAAAKAHLARLGFADAATIVQERDETFLARCTDRFDAIYIDTSHDYETVARQITNVARLLTEDGLICGDDYSDQGTWGVKRAVTELVPGHLVFANWIWIGARDQIKVPPAANAA